jgi:hypothetical protein
VVDVTLDDLRSALGVLSTAPDGPIDVVALGSPHFSLDEFARLLPLVEAHPPRPEVEFIVCTHRLALAALQQRGWLARLRAVGVQVIVDTCVVVTPIVRARGGVLMTNSGKFAHYSPGNIGLQVVYGSLEECVRSGAGGVVWRDAGLWAGEQGSRGAEERDQYSVGQSVSGQWPVAGHQLPEQQPSPRAPLNTDLLPTALVLDAPLSLWGGLEPTTGDIIDQRHPQCGANVRGAGAGNAGGQRQQQRQQHPAGSGAVGHGPGGYRAGRDGRDIGPGRGRGAGDVWGGGAGGGGWRRTVQTA